MKRLATFGAAVVTLAASASAQQPGAPPAPIPTNSYSGYAFAECGPSNSPIVRLVLPAGAAAVPATLPASPPRPRVELVVQASIDRATGQEITIAADGGGEAGLTAAGLSCPLMGNCSRAQRGRLSFTREADGALRGEFRARWPDEPARATDVIGRFTAVWFDSQSPCR